MSAEHGFAVYRTKALNPTIAPTQWLPPVEHRELVGHLQLDCGAAARTPRGANTIAEGQ